MVITRSPFVKKQSIDYGYGIDEDGNQTYTNALGVTSLVVPNDDKKNKTKTSLKQEQNLFGKVINKASRLANKLPDAPAAKVLRSITDLAETGRDPKSIGRGLIGLAADTTNVLTGGAINKSMEILARPAKFVKAPIQSTVNEVAEKLYTTINVPLGATPIYESGPLKGQKVEGKLSDLVGFDKEYKLPLPDSKTSKIVQFFADVVADPTTYFTLPASQASKAHRVALATRMAQLAPKYPELVPVLDDIARYGATEIPDTVKAAENIFSGIKYMGFEIPHSAAIAKAWRYTLGDVRANIGDKLYRHTPSVLNYTSRASTKKLTELGIGRGIKSGQDWIDTYLGGLAEYSSSLHMRGKQNAFALTIMGKSQQLRIDIQNLTDAESIEVYKIIENRSPVYASSDNVQKVVENFRLWENESYDSVKQLRKVFGNKWGVIVGDLGFVEDHLYHTMTDKAREWMRTKGSASGWFDDYEFVGSGVEKGQGISSYRRLKGATYNVDGSIKHVEKFMDEPVMAGTIEEINEISMKKIGMPWFKTDIKEILASTNQSYAAMAGRVAYYDRMMEFGPTIAKSLTKYVVPDETLAKALVTTTSSLMKAQQKLFNRVRRGIPTYAATREGVAAELTVVSDLAQSVLTTNRIRKVAVDEEIQQIVKEVDNVITELQKIGEQATLMTSNAKGEFNDIWSSLIREAESYRAALIDGTGERFMTLKELRKEYVSLYPNADQVDIADKSVEWFAERIVRAAGGENAIEAREAARLETKQFLLQQRDLLPANATDELRLIDEKLIETDLELEAIGRLNQAKINASYADDGLIFGFVPQVTDEPMPFQLFTTKPIDNEFGTFRQMPDAIAGHAIPDNQLLDLRDPETFLNFMNPEYWADDINKAWQQVGVGEYISESDVANMLKNKGVLDPEFIRVNPEKAEFLMGMYDMFVRTENSFNEGNMQKLTGSELTQFFDWFDDMQKRIAHSISPDNSDVVGNTVTQWWFKSLVDSAEEYGFKGALVPATNVFDDSFSGATNGWAVLLPSNAKPPVVGSSIVDPWQMVENNSFIANSLDGVMESVELSALNKSESLRAAGVNIADTVSKRAEIDKALLNNENQEQSIKALLALRSNDSLLINNVPVPKNEVVANLAKTDEFLQKSYDDIDKQIKAEIEAQFGVKELETQRLSYEERLPMLLDEAKVLETWTEGTEAGLQQEIMDMILLIQNKPAKGSTGASNAAWVRHVEGTMASSSLIDDPVVRQAYDRVTTILHADEVALAKINNQIAQNMNWLTMVKMGVHGGTLVNAAADKGWKEITNLGIQMPREVLDVWGPNLKKLTDIKEYNKFINGLDMVQQYWKRYVTSSVGFFVRNGMSATFMNYADGVSNQAIMTGTKWASAQVERKGGTLLKTKNFSDWIARVGITDPAEIAKAEWATQVVLATGHGVSDDFAAPTIGRARIVTDNGYLRFFSKKNNFVETAARLPMAIDSFEKGMTFDEAVARINRVHFDYSDLSKLDITAKKLVPFWIWTSRNLPLQLTQIATRPKAYYEYERLNREYPVNPALIMPKWIADRDPMGILSNWVLTPDLPHVRLGNQISSLSNIAGNLRPDLKLMLELVSNRKLGIDVGKFNQGGFQSVRGYETPIAKMLEKLAGRGLVDYDKEGNLIMDARVNHIVETFLPTLAQINRLSGGITGGKETLEERMVSSWLNWFGIPARKIDEVQQRSEIIRRKYKGEKLIKELEKELEKIKNED